MKKTVILMALLAGAFAGNPIKSRLAQAQAKECDTAPLQQ
jgi:hypothetical protein